MNTIIVLGLGALLFTSIIWSEKAQAAMFFFALGIVAMMGVTGTVP